MSLRLTWKGHLFALITELIWGMTFAASQILVNCLDSYWFIVLRFGSAWLLLFLLSPRPLKPMEWKRERWVLLCGILGITLYYILQNIALLHSTASNTGVLSATSPIFTALWLCLFSRKVRLKPLFFFGFVLCMAGVAVISFRGGGAGGVHLFGDTIALLAALSWGLYCVFVSRTEDTGLSALQMTRKILFWGFLLCLPFALIAGDAGTIRAFAGGGGKLWGAFAYVVIGASVICYVFWGKATALLGSVTTSLYMYLLPVFTVIGSAIIVHDPVTPFTFVGIAAILVGVALSQRGSVPVEAAETDAPPFPHKETREIEKSS